MKKKWWLIPFAVIGVFCICPLSWVSVIVVSGLDGWTEVDLRTFVASSVKRGRTRQEVKDWCAKQGWTVLERDIDKERSQGGQTSISDWAGLKPDDVAWVIIAYPSLDKVYQGFGIVTWTELYAIFYFDKDGRLIRSHVTARYGGP